MIKATNVLLLDVKPTSNLCDNLHGILESSQQNDVHLQQETLSSDDPRGDVESAWPELISRFRPAVSFLVSSRNALGQVRSFFQTLGRDQFEHPIIVVSDADGPDEMFELIKLGAADFIVPPLTPTGILPRFWRLIEQTRWSDHLAQKLKGKSPGSKVLIGESPAFLSAVNKVTMVAKSDATIMISGETGTGKELFANAIHNLSLRAGGPFIPVNCGAIPAELVENELFGHERSAFTGAATARPGLIQEADGGTLFLDEIDSLPLLSQVKLLRFLQEKEYRPLGSTRTRHANLRVVTATNVNVEKAVCDGKLRQDLYYRLNMIPITLPPLRERREDIKLLAANFLLRYANEFKKNAIGFSTDALQKLMLYEWPGNVRELEHVVGRAVALSGQSTIRGVDVVLPSSGSSPNQESFQQAKAKVIAQFERTYLQGLLLAHQGNITKAAQAAQKDRGAFWQLLRKHRIDIQRFRSVPLEERDNSYSKV